VPFPAPAAITRLSYQMKADRVSLRLSLWSSVAGSICTGLLRPFATAVDPEPLIIDLRLVILRYGFERLDLNHQSNIGHRRTKATIKIVVPWSLQKKQKGKHI